MSSKRDLYRFFAIATLFSFAAIYLGFSFGYPRTYTPEKSYAIFSKVSRDGWIENGATIKLPRLFHRGNRIDLNLHSWRPPGMAPAELVFSLCGKEISTVVVDADKTHRLFLTGECEPREVQIEVKNPFVASETDTRELGAQLTSLTLGSKIGPPITTPEISLFIVPWVFLFVVSFGLLFPVRFRIAASFLASLFVYQMVNSIHLTSVSRLQPLWMALTFIFLGALLVRDGSKSGDSESPIKGETLWLLVILIGGAILRFGVITFGLPMNFHPDEVPKVNAIMRMYASGTLDPDYFLHPTLLLYSTYAMNTLLQGVGVFTGEFQSTLALSGRVVSALAGVGSIYLTYAIGKKLISSKVGLFAALLLAVFPLHVTCSRYLKEDSLLTFFVLLSVYFSTIALKSKDLRWLLLSGIAAGCSASVKYSGLLSLGIPGLTALCIEGRFPREKKTYFYLLGALLLIPIFFVLCSPYTILNSSKFIEDFFVEQRHMSKGHYFAITGWSQYWTYHLSRSMWPGTTIVPLVLTLLGMGYFVRKKNQAGIILTIFLLAFYFPAEYVKAKPAPQPERYIVPCLPFMALIASGFLFQIISGRKRQLLVVLLVASLPFLRTLMLYSDLTPDTRTQMMSWMEENISKEKKIYIDHKRYSPELSEERFTITYAPRANIHRDLDLELLKGEGYDYLLLSSLWYDRYFSQPRTDTGVRRKIRKILDNGKIVKRFEPRYGTYGFHNPTVTLFAVSE